MKKPHFYLFIFAFWLLSFLFVSSESPAGDSDANMATSESLSGDSDGTEIFRKDAKEAKNAKNKINPEYSGASFANFVPSTREETFPSDGTDPAQCAWTFEFFYGGLVYNVPMRLNIKQRGEEV